MTNARQENARMLASILGIDEDEASECLDRTVLVTIGPDAARLWVDEVLLLLSLTVGVTQDPAVAVHGELVLGSADRRTSAACLWAAVNADEVVIADQPLRIPAGTPHPFLCGIAACPVVAAAIRLAVPEISLPSPQVPIRFAFSQLGLPDNMLTRRRDLSGSVLVGAGAVGHGVLRAMRHLPVHGTLAIVDPKKVGAGNFNRCTYLHADDLGEDKAAALAMRAASDFPDLVIEPCVEEFRDYCKRSGPPATAFVTVDSRRARRSIQSELPGRVLDASTTDIRAVVVHSHSQPNPHACMSCIYAHVPEEHLRERAIADGLGIDIEVVKQGFISELAAAEIAKSHGTIQPGAIVGMAYDSLFKQLCAAQSLQTSDNRQVLAPFAFVSTLAGYLLVVEMLRSDAGMEESNYWVVDPWGAPIQRRRVLRPRKPDCEFCSRPEVDVAARELWRRRSAV